LRIREKGKEEEIKRNEKEKKEGRKIKDGGKME
jgi:hypothetical protein